MTYLANRQAVIPRKSVRRRSQRQGGSAILEGALVMLPLMAIGFALLDYPLGIFIQNTMRHAVREGVRFAVTQQTGAGGQDEASKTAVKNNSIGFINDSDLNATPTPKATLTVTYYDQSTLAVVSGVGSNRQGNICVVTATITRAWMAPLWRDTVC
jgi:Flp pilus assembly protein TadG